MNNVQHGAVISEDDDGALVTEEEICVDGTHVKIYDVRNAAGEDTTHEYLQDMVLGIDVAGDSPCPASMQMIMLDEHRAIMQNEHSEVPPKHPAVNAVATGTINDPVDLTSPSSALQSNFDKQIAATPAASISEEILNEADTIIYEPYISPDSIVPPRKRKLELPKREDAFLDALATEYGSTSPLPSAEENTTVLLVSIIECFQKKISPVCNT